MLFNNRKIGKGQTQILRFIKENLEKKRIEKRRSLEQLLGKMSIKVQASKYN